MVANEVQFLGVADWFYALRLGRRQRGFDSLHLDPIPSNHRMVHFRINKRKIVSRYGIAELFLGAIQETGVRVSLPALCSWCNW